MPGYRLHDDTLFTEGPSREELFDALRLFNENRVVNFRLETGALLKARIFGIKIEDGTGFSWEVTLDCSRNQDGYILEGANRVVIYYSGRTRQGKVLSIGH